MHSKLNPSNGRLYYDDADRHYDFEIRNEGSLFLFRPLTDEARWWIAENIREPRWWAGSLVVENGYAANVIRAFTKSGLRC